MWGQISRTIVPVRLFHPFRRVIEQRRKATGRDHIRVTGLKASTKGAIWATAVAVAFIANPTHAEDSGSSPQPTLIACLGVNSCKGQSACKSFDHDCQAMNTCKGNGFILITEDECKQKGGKVIDPDQM